MYAHENGNTSEKAESKLVQALIQLLQRVRPKIVSDRSPLLRDSRSIRKEGKLPVHNILWNQFCLLPKSGQADKINEVVGSVDKVLFCSSEVLQSYHQDNRMKKYTEEIKEFYAKSANLRKGTNKDIDEFKRGMDDIVKNFCNQGGFHHVITEMAFLEIRAEQEKDPKCHSIIPVILNSGDTHPFDKLLVRVKATKLSNEGIIHESQILHKLFFDVLKRLFEDLHLIIKEFEYCYNNCVTMLNPELNLPLQWEFEESMSKEVLKTTLRLARDALASIRAG